MMGPSSTSAPVPVTRSIRGFALPVVLLTLTAIGGITVGIVSKGTAGAVDAVSLERRARERLLLDAGVTRGILALLAPDDPLTEPLRRDGQVAWSFAGRELTIAVSPETAKLDLNSADPGALAVMLNRVLGPELGEGALDAVLSARGSLTTPGQILPLLPRLSSAGARLRDAATVYGGQVEEREHVMASADGLSAAASSERPIYTVRVKLAGGTRARAATVLIEPEAHRYAMLDRGDFEMDEVRPDQ